MKLKEYSDRDWTWSVLRMRSIVGHFFKNVFIIKCPKCKVGRVKYIGDDWTGMTWIGVYECNKCNTEFV